jgi:hypothetical protein
MAKKTESKFFDELKSGLLIPYNYSILNIHGHLMQSTSWPDMYVFKKGLAFWIELKVWPRTILQNISQMQRIDEMRGKGVPVLVLTLLDDKQGERKVIVDNGLFGKYKKGMSLSETAYTTLEIDGKIHPQDAFDAVLSMAVEAFKNNA